MDYNNEKKKKEIIFEKKKLIKMFISNINEQSKSPYLAAFPVHLMGSEVPVVQLIHPVIMMIYDVLSHLDTLQMWHRLSLFDSINLTVHCSISRFTIGVYSRPRYIFAMQFEYLLTPLIN